MIHFMREMLGTFRGVTQERMAASANYLLTLLIIREMAAKLNVTFAYAAEIVGKMEIRVDDDAYAENTELFNDLAREMVRIMADALALYSKELGRDAAHQMVKGIASGMSLKYG